MCDAATGLTRREFTTLGAAVLSGTAWSEAKALEAGLTEAMTRIETADGTCEAFFVYPASGKHPGVVFWPDGIGFRETKKAMARRLAAEGYAVLVVNQYYRDAALPLGIGFDTWRSDEGRAKMMVLFGHLNPEAVARDAAAFVAFLDRQDAVDKARGIGAQGYCMGGPIAVRTAAAAPARVTAAASFHGGGLVTDRDDSPHKLLAQTQASYLIAIGKDDDARAPAEKDVIRAAAQAAGRPAEIEVYGGDHSWCVPDAPAYDHAEAERAYARLMALYAKL